MRCQSLSAAFVGLIIGLAFIACQSSAASTVSAADFPEPLKIIQTEGQYIFTDGSSYYLLKKDGTFKSGPLGMSGREITGTWKSQDGLFVIEGLWGWMNGISALNDYRRMTIYLSAPTSVETAKNLPWVEASAGVKVYKCYFTVEELQKLPKPRVAR